MQAINCFESDRQGIGSKLLEAAESEVLHFT